MKVHQLSFASATAVVVGLACAAMAASTGDLTCSWSDQFSLSDFDDTVGALAMFDDGGGPALFAGGSFWHAGGVLARAVARWTGAGWAPVGGPLGGILGPGVSALAVFDDGTGPALYAGGRFTTADGFAVNHVARWDGSTWTPLAGPSGTGVDGASYTQVIALAVFDDGTGPALYVGGRFESAGGVTATNLARWDGSQWSAVSGPTGEGADGEVSSLEAWNGSLYVGGSFATGGGVTVNRVARWDAQGWEALSGPSGTGVNGRVLALEVFDDGSGPALYAGGGFSTAGGVAAEHLARWDGSAWSAVGEPGDPGVDSLVYTLLARTEGAGPALYVGGAFVNAGGLTVNGVARWDGQAWSALPGPARPGLESSGALELAEVNDGSGPVLVIGGSFLLAGGLEANRIARWDGTELGWWSPPDGAGLSHYALSLAVHDDDGGRRVYAGGVFTHASGMRVDSIARWEGGAWAPLAGPGGTGLTGGWPWSLTSCPVGGTPGLFAGGDFLDAGGLRVNSVARWDGEEWSPLYGPGGPGVTTVGLPGIVYASACLERAAGPALVVGGDFDTAGGAPAANLAVWNGAGWATLAGPSGEGVDGTVHALVATGGDAPVLYVGGSFGTAGGVAAANVAAWDGTTWSALEGPAGNGLDGYVSAIALYDHGLGPELFVGGAFTTAGGLPAAALARWNGTAWSAVPGFSDFALDQVVTLAVHDDGSGPALYATASRVDGVMIADFALLRWDGSTWTVRVDEPVADLWGPVAAMTSFDDGSGPALWLGGLFRRMGGQPATYVTRYWCDARLFADGFETGTSDAWPLVVP